MRVTISDVSVRVAGQRLLEGVSADVPSGATLGVVGPNGSGKSTLLRCLYRELQPEVGVVLVDDVAISQRSLSEHARAVAALTQDQSADLDFTVRELVTLGRHPHPRGPQDTLCVDTALAQTETTHLVSRSVLALSGGERQRVLIARALAQTTPVLVLDEPTNHLDLRHQMHVVADVARSDRTVILALHDLNLASAICDQLIVMNHGRVVAIGTPRDVLRPDLIESVYGVRPVLVDHPETGVPQILFTPSETPTRETLT